MNEDRHTIAEPSITLDPYVICEANIKMRSSESLRASHLDIEIQNGIAKSQLFHAVQRLNAKNLYRGGK